LCISFSPHKIPWERGLQAPVSMHGSWILQKRGVMLNLRTLLSVLVSASVHFPD
jgi:hypothetical protein